MSGETGVKLDVWFDYTCPYTFSAAVWLEQVKRSYGDRLQLEWHCFPLEQVNSRNGYDWKLWEQPDDYPSRSIWAFRAGEAARLQGEEAFGRFSMELLRARHADRANLADRNVLLKVAAGVGLEMAAFERALDDRGLLAKIGADYERGVDEFGIWGTPTLVFDGEQAAYLRLRPAPPAEEAVKLFEELRGTLTARPYLLEIKRPR